MKPLSKYMLEKAKEDRPLVVPYFMAGMRPLETLREDIELLADNGATAIEIGVPFSDPVADGPVIQAAGLQALGNGTSLQAIIEYLKTYQSPVPLVLMTYFNLFYHYGLERLVSDLAETDVEGLIIPDLPQEMYFKAQPIVDDENLALIPLVSLTSDFTRIKELTENAEGFVYAVTVNGVTGVGRTFNDELNAHFEKTAAVSPVPVLAGFGIDSKEAVAHFNELCDGVVIGSKIVQEFAEGHRRELADFLTSLTTICNKNKKTA